MFEVDIVTHLGTVPSSKVWDMHFSKLELGRVQLVSPNSAVKRLQGQENSPEATRETLTLNIRAHFARF